MEFNVSSNSGYNGPQVNMNVNMPYTALRNFFSSGQVYAQSPTAEVQITAPPVYYQQPPQQVYYAPPAPQGVVVVNVNFAHNL